MTVLRGVISDKLRKIFSADNPAWTAKRTGEAPPSADSIRHGKGQGLGKGATRKRSGEGAQT